MSVLQTISCPYPQPTLPILGEREQNSSSLSPKALEKELGDEGLQR